MERETDKVVDKNRIGEPYDPEDLTKFFEGIENIHFDPDKDAEDCTDMFLNCNTNIKNLDMSDWNISDEDKNLIINIDIDDEEDSVFKKIGNTIFNIILIVFVLFVLWLIFSVVDTNMHNLSDFKYAPWNIFNLLKYFR